MNKSDQNHPIWRFLNLVIILIVVWICSASQASNFDETELKMIGMILIAMGGWEAVKNKISKKDGE